MLLGLGKFQEPGNAQSGFLNVNLKRRSIPFHPAEAMLSRGCCPCLHRDTFPPLSSEAQGLPPGSMLLPRQMTQFFVKVTSSQLPCLDNICRAPLPCTLYLRVFAYGLATPSDGALLAWMKTADSIYKYRL